MNKYVRYRFYITIALFLITSGIALYVYLRNGNDPISRSFRIAGTLCLLYAAFYGYFKKRTGK